MLTPGTQVNRQGAGAGRGKRNESALAYSTRALQRHEAEHRVLDHVCRKRVHDHAEQFHPADAFAAQDADDRVIA